MSKPKYDLQMKLEDHNWTIQVNGEVVFSGKYESCKRIYKDEKQHKYYKNLYVENFVKK